MRAVICKYGEFSNRPILCRVPESAPKIHDGENLLINTIKERTVKAESICSEFIISDTAAENLTYFIPTDYSITIGELVFPIVVGKWEYTEDIWETQYGTRKD